MDNNVPILWLPNEVLLRIFAYLRHDFLDPSFDDESLLIDPPLSSTADDIKSLRLTCRRFCHLSSEFLQQSVRVDLTEPSSLQRLDQISRDPMLRKKIRSVQVVLKYYSPTQAENFQCFARIQHRKLESVFARWFRQLNGGLASRHPPTMEPLNETMETKKSAMAKAEEYLSSWGNVMINNGTEEDASDDPAKALLLRAHVEYQRRYDEMNSVLCNGGFVTAIIAAMGNMPRVKLLDIRDGDQDRNTAQKTLLPQEVMSPDLLYEQLLYPNMNWSNGEISLDPPPVHLVPDLLLAAAQRDVRITGLAIRTSPFLVEHLPDETHAQLRKAVRHLKVLHFKPDTYRAIQISRGFWQSLPEEHWQGFSAFMPSLVASRALKRLTIDLSLLWNTDSPPINMGSVLSSHNWPNLEYLSFDGPFELENIQQLIGAVPQNLNIELSGYLSK